MRWHEVAADREVLLFMSFDIADARIEATINDSSGQEIFDDRLSVFEAGIIGDVYDGVVTLLLGDKVCVNSGECRDHNFVTYLQVYTATCDCHSTLE